MNSQFKHCIDKHKLIKVKDTADLISKELSESQSDLSSAQSSLNEKNHKWTIVQAYYSMFHASKALIYKKGYREKSHHCLAIALKALFVDENIMEEKYYNYFRDCMALRHDADYGMIYSAESSKEVVDWAKEFLKEAKKLIDGDESDVCSSNSTKKKTRTP